MLINSVRRTHDGALWCAPSSSNARIQTRCFAIFTIATITMSRYKITMSRQFFPTAERDVDFTSERFATAAMMTATIAAALGYSAVNTFCPLEPRAKGSRHRNLLNVLTTPLTRRLTAGGRSPEREFNAFRSQGRRVCVAAYARTVLEVS